MVSYAQGYMLLRAAEKEFGWKLNMGGIALMWRGGCIIRSIFLSDIKAAFDKDPNLSNLLLDGFFSSALNKYQGSWREGADQGDRAGCADSGVLDGAGVLRWLPHGAAAGEPAAGAARLLWRAYL